jgi:SAM-dependent methyltransferase
MKKIFLNLGKLPLANRLLNKNNLNKKEFKYISKIQFDTKTLLVSLKKKIPSKKMFNDNYPYKSSISNMINNSYKKLSLQIKKKIQPKKILEIGSNDGTFVKHFNKENTIGVEPVKKHAKITNNLGYLTYNDFWNIKLANKIFKNNGKFDLIFSANTISHISNLKNTLKAIKFLLKKNGTFILEDPSLLEVVKNNAYDQFYDEHIYVFSTLALVKVLKEHKLEIYKIENLNTHGGSNRYFICNIGLKVIEDSVSNNIKNEKKFKLNTIAAFKNFSKRVQKSKKSLIKIFKNLKKNKKIIIGYGASAKATLILNYCKLSTKQIDYFTDSTKDKQNKYIPGVKIKIKKEPKKIAKEVDYAFLGAWNFYKEIKKKERNFLYRGGKFITHVPFPRILK